MSVFTSILVVSLSRNGKNVELLGRTNGRCVVHDDEDSGTLLMIKNGNDLRRGEKVCHPPMTRRN